MDDNLHAARPQDVIVKDSETFDLLERVTNQTDDPLEDIVCIDFIYPLEVKLYNADLFEIGRVTLTGDNEFSEFLGAISPNQALSISYPISTTLADGTVFSVNNNAELKLAIDNCSREDIVASCNSIFVNDEAICVWRVGYGENMNNKYAGGIFRVNADFSLVFTYKDVDYPGNWIFLFVDDQLHININLEGTSAIAADWNIDRRMALSDDTITIATLPLPIVLNRHCEESDEYAIGDNGPAGGIVFYDKGAYSNGWRYIETAAQDLDWFEWGCAGSLVGDTSAGIGTGMINSSLVAYHHDNMDNYYNNPSVCNPANNGTVASRKALLYQLGQYDDWFLPSEAELDLMYVNLHAQGLGNFVAAPYWSSTESDAGNSRSVDFADGTASSVVKISPNTVRTRPVRYF